MDNFISKSMIPNIITNTPHKLCRYNLNVVFDIDELTMEDKNKIHLIIRKCCQKCGKYKTYGSYLTVDRTEENIKKYYIDINKITHNHTLKNIEYFCDLYDTWNNVTKKNILDCSSILNTCYEYEELYNYNDYLKYCIDENIDEVVYNIDDTCNHIKYKFKNGIEIFYINMYRKEFTSKKDKLCPICNLKTSSKEIRNHRCKSIDLTYKSIESEWDEVTILCNNCGGIKKKCNDDKKTEINYYGNCSIGFK